MIQSPSLPQPQRWLRFLDASSRLFGGGRVSLDPARLLKRCGGTFEDKSFEPALESFCSAFDGDTSLTFAGRRGLNWMTLDALHRRQSVERDARENPQIRTIPVERPIFVLGAPRTGTTLLQQLLTLDTECRWLRPWELEQPYPAKPDWGGPRDKRRSAHEKNVVKLRKSAAAIDSIHPVDSPAECWQLLWNSFASHTIFLFFGLGNAYEKWRTTLTFERSLAAYRFYKLQLQHLMWLHPRRYWVLKAPEHTVHLRALREVFPDAVLVQMQRPPVEFTPSLCSLAWHCEFCSVRNCDTWTLGRQVVRTMSAWTKTNAGDRAQLPPGSVLDVDYRELVEQPKQVVRRIRDRAGRPSGRAEQELEERMEEWLAANHRTRKQSHRYSLEQFGLDAAFVEREFGAPAIQVSARVG